MRSAVPRAAFTRGWPQGHDKERYDKEPSAMPRQPQRRLHRDQGHVPQGRRPQPCPQSPGRRRPGQEPDQAQQQQRPRRTRQGQRYQARGRRRPKPSIHPHPDDRSSGTRPHRHRRPQGLGSRYVSSAPSGARRAVQAPSVPPSASCTRCGTWSYDRRPRIAPPLV